MTASDLRNRLAAAFPPGRSAGAFFLSVALWGVAFGCFQAVMNNFLSEIHHFSELERGWLEFFREMPGLLLVFMLAALHKAGNWKVMRLGALIACIGVSALLIPADKKLSRISSTRVRKLINSGKSAEALVGAAAFTQKDKGVKA